MTLHREAVEKAHLVPTAQTPWFNENLMAHYTRVDAVDKTKDVGNIITLRSDIHTILDAKRFAFVPKKGQLVVHTFGEKAQSEVYRLYHNTRVHQSEVNVQFLFARYAYALFQSLMPFLNANQPRKLRLTKEDVPQRECTSHECGQYAHETAYQGKSRSASPR